MARTCKTGHILRKGYTRKTGVRVAATCVKDMGAPGKGKDLIGPLKHGELSQFGYNTSKTVRSRHIALNKAVKKYGQLSVSRKLNALAVYTKRTSPNTSKRAIADRMFVSKTNY